MLVMKKQTLYSNVAARKMNTEIQFYRYVKHNCSVYTPPFYIPFLDLFYSAEENTNAILRLLWLPQEISLGFGVRDL